MRLETDSQCAMNTTFQDLQHDDNPRNGEVMGDPQTVVALLDELRTVRPPFMCQFVGDNGYNLTIGIDEDIGCVQHSANDGSPPYLMAVDPTGHHQRMEFVVGDTATPIDGRYRLPIRTVRELVATFITSGGRSNCVEWEELE
jgi:Immunity protein Imm1